MGILVIGSVALDTVTTPFGSITDGLGGSGTHFGVSASYFTKVAMVAVVGTDFPQEHVEFLKSRGIDVSGLEIVSGKTFRWAGHYGIDLNSAQTLKTELNVFQNFVPKVPQKFQQNDFVFLANIDPDLQRSVIEQVKKPKLLACDTMNFWIEGKRESLLKTIRLVDMIVINEGEARLLSGKTNLVKAATDIHQLGPRIVVIKQGEYGALLFYEGHIFSAPGMPLSDVFDPTGAGDSFAGGLFGYLAMKNDLSLSTFRQAMIVGSVMASYNVEKFSCDRIRNLTQQDLHTRYTAFKNLSHFDEISF